jgi:hypothetical protein
MTPFASLWLPLLLSTVFVFLLSWMIHMLPLWHKSSFPKLANEDAVRAALRPLNLPVGDYMIPRPKDHAEMRTPEFMEKFKEGPVLGMTVMPSGRISMGSSLAQWFLFCGFIGLTATCVAGTALAPGADPLRVFHLTGITALSGYTFALWEMSIWYKRGWSLTLKSTLDGIIYAAATAGTFCWLWPK